MPNGYTAKDYTKEVLNKLEENISAALDAMGLAAVGFVVDTMKTGYQDPHPNRNYKGEIDGTGFHTDIRHTGDLIRDVNYEVERSGKHTVDIGNSLHYAKYVHEGTCKLRGRPYLKDGIERHRKELQDIAESYIKNF